MADPNRRSFRPRSRRRLQFGTPVMGLEQLRIAHGEDAVEGWQPRRRRIDVSTQELPALEPPG